MVMTKLLERDTSQDVVMSGLVIKTANSPITGLSGQVTSIHHAVMLLGLTRFSNLVVSSAITLAIGRLDSQLVTYWESARVIAKCAAKISTYLQSTESEEAYTAGLFQSCGAMFMAKKFNNYIEATAQLARDNPCSILTTENELYGTNHAIVAFVVAKKWGLPPDICHGIYHHHSNNLGQIQSDNVRTIAALLILAAWLADEIWLNAAIDSPEREICKNQSMAELMITDSDLDTLRADIREDLNDGN